jgi:hypothetical protein
MIILPYLEVSFFSDRITVLCVSCAKNNFTVTPDHVISDLVTSGWSRLAARSLLITD